MSAPDLQPLLALAAALQEASKQKAAHYAPIARQLIPSRSIHIQEIEHTRGHLLDVACIPEGLAPFKALCRYYFTLDPAATATYINGYREMWDSDANQETEAET